MRLINRNFAKLFYGQAISSIGDFIFDTTLILWLSTRLLAGKSYAPIAVSGILVAVAAATIVVAPVAGVFADRWDKRRTMMTSDLIRAVLVGGLAVVALLPAGTLPVGVILGLAYAVVLISTGVSQFFMPARFTLIGDIVPGDADRAKASGLSQSVAYTAAIIGPPLAAPLLFATGVYWALIINSLSFLVSFVAIRAIQVAPAEAPVPVEAPDPLVETPALAFGTEAEMEQLAAAPAEEAAGFWSELAGGLLFLMRNPVMRVVMIAVTIATLGSGALNALLVFFVTGNLHANAHWFGTIGMGEGIGAVVGSLAAGWICSKFSDVRVFATALTTVGIATFVFAKLGNLPVAIAVLALTGIPLGALNVALTPILLRAVPREMLGRVGGVLTPVQQVASMTSALVSGWLVSSVLRDFHHTVGGVSFGPVDTVFTGCGLLVTIGGIYALLGLRGTAPIAAIPAQREPDATVTAQV